VDRVLQVERLDKRREVGPPSFVVIAEFVLP
jgi:hypothetical protein